jgi:hypothetical protein
MRPMSEFWHDAAIPKCPLKGPYWGGSGHDMVAPNIVTLAMSRNNKA